MYRLGVLARTARIGYVARRWNHSKDPLGLSSFLNEIKYDQLKDESTPNDLDVKNSINPQDPPQRTSQDTADVQDELSELLASLNLADDVKVVADSKNSDDEFSPVNIDASDENDGNAEIFDKSFLNFEEPSAAREIVKQERDLFEEIFDSYKNIFETPEERNKKVFQKLSGAYSGRSRGMVDRAYDETMFNKIKEKLEPTITYIEGSEDRQQLVQTTNVLFEQISTLLKQEDQDELFLPHLVQHKEMTEDHEALLNKVEKFSADDALRPHLNVFTIPVVFNAILRTCAYKLKDGQLALTIFNSLKTDLALYTICCNQDTYNEILRTLWIYQGKSSLYSIDTMYTEMLNNGFEGNLLTLGLCKQILTDYYHLRMGNLEVFRSNLPVWSKEDDKKAEKLEGHLRRLSSRIKSRM